LRRATTEERQAVQAVLSAAPPAVLAAASVQRHRAQQSRWFGARWADKLVNSGRKLLWTGSGSGGSGLADDDLAYGALNAAAESGLVDSSAASRAAAAGKAVSVGTSENGHGGSRSGSGGGGGGGGSGRDGGSGGSGRMAIAAVETEKDAAPHAYDAAAVTGLAELVAVLLRRWGTGANGSNPLTVGMLNTLCFSAGIVPKLWAFIQAEQPGFDHLLAATPMMAVEGAGAHAVLAVFAATFQHLLIVSDDAEVYERGRPLPLHHVQRSVALMAKQLFRACWTESGAGAAGTMAAAGQFSAFYAGALERALRSLYD
ncbi:unnamed protein product, partial [Phaeothamnion confervicola]